MADVTGVYTSQTPTISQNTASILRHKAQYYNGSGAINLPLKKGLRYIIYSVITAGATISIGFGKNAGTIVTTKFTFTQTAGPLDLSSFFEAAPFCQYIEPTEDNVYLIITGTGAITAAVTTFNG
jgi:hypothetical protein